MRGTHGPWRDAVISALGRRLATSVRIGMGTSLGGLAMLHAYCRYPDTFDALFLQSGSFFCPRFDEHERHFRYYPRMVRFVASVLDSAASHGTPATGMPATGTLTRRACRTGGSPSS